jgi:hexosaminidase
MFPFWGRLNVGSAGNAYSKENIKELVELADDYKFEVIPLVQTFGHLEFFLKMKQFRHLREIDEFPQVLKH